MISDVYQRTYQITGQTTGQLVDFRVSCSNVNGESELSDVLTLYVADKPAAPSTPTETSVHLSDLSKDNVAIQVSWSEPASNGAPITGYQLFMAEEALAYVAVYNGTNRADVLTYTVTSTITKRRSYHFQVLAINAVGSSPLSTP